MCSINEPLLTGEQFPKVAKQLRLQRVAALRISEHTPIGMEQKLLRLFVSAQS